MSVAAVRVRVRLNANLRAFSRRKLPRELRLALPAGSSVGDLVASLEIAPDRLGPVVVNLATVGLDRALCDGDEIILFPPVMAGG